MHTFNDIEHMIVASPNAILSGKVDSFTAL